MRVTDEEIKFDKSDSRLIERLGLPKAVELALECDKKYGHPPIMDIYQLSRVLGCGFEVINSVRKDASKHYYSYPIRTSAGKLRTISEPDCTLSFAQHRIKRAILDNYQVSRYATAYYKGAKLIDNTTIHCGKKNVLKMDLKDFFGHITYEKVYKSVFNSNHFPAFIGLTLTDFCCLNGCLPQGACTSPAISNIVMKPFDEIIGAWCEKNNIGYTRYSDDITFSSDEPLFVAYEKAKGLIEAMGFEVNDAKTRFLSRGQRQSVTGLVVNEKPNVSASYRQKLRQEVYYAVKYGQADGIEKTELQRLLGKVNYVVQINPELEWFVNAREKLIGMMAIGK